MFSGGNTDDSSNCSKLSCIRRFETSHDGAGGGEGREVDGGWGGAEKVEVGQRRLGWGSSS